MCCKDDAGVDGTRCECGLPALSYCGMGIPGFTPIACRKPICQSDGINRCSAHRHRPGTMGYVDHERVCADFHRFVPSKGLRGFRHLIDVLHMALRNLFLTESAKAQRTMIDILSYYTPPAPPPEFVEITMLSTGNVYKMERGECGPTMVKEDNDEW